MRRIAHLSDVHILDARAPGAMGARQTRYRLATKFVSIGRGIDPKDRRRRLERALASAKANGADHFVISGDLTEVGEEAEFEHFAEVLHDARLPADSVTLVPGNHDAYTLPNAWKRAMEGPLAAFAAGSAAKAGRVVDRGPVVFLPIDTSYFQSIAWSGGLFTRAMTEAVERRLVDPAFRSAALVLVLHHPPFHPHALPIVRWIDGLRGGAEVLELLSRHPRLQLLHGHLHRVLDRILHRTGSSLTTRSPDPSADPSGTDRGPTRLFGAPATCDGTRQRGQEDTPNFRLYDVRDGALYPAPVRAA
jgi:3',5'-cyclic AMP phosphodiesterase CpdA